MIPFCRAGPCESAVRGTKLNEKLDRLDLCALAVRRVAQRCAPLHLLYATVPQGTVATTVASDWLANELAEYGEIDAACRDRFVMHLMTAAGASAPADAVFRFTAGEAMQTSRPTSASGEDDDEDTGSEEYSDDRASD